MAFSLFVGAVTAYSYGQQRKETRRAAAEAQRRFEISERKAEVQNVRSFRQAIRQQRLAQGAMMNVAAQTGGFGGSGLAGGLASTTSQTAGTVGTMAEIAQYNTQMGQAAVQESKSLAEANLYGQLGGTMLNIFGQAGGFSPKTYGG
jgi:hypothetical protein